MSLSDRFPARAVLPLRRDGLRLLPRTVSVPSYDVGELRPGVVHLGLGSFARGHVAVYLDRLAETRASQDWGLVGCGLRTASAGAVLGRQDNLWTVVDPARGRARVVGALRDYVDATRSAGPLLRHLADPRTELVTLTITAPAYDVVCADEQSGTGGSGDRTFALVAEALRRRRATGAAPFTVLSCDNLPDNGAATRRAVVAAADRISPELAEWVGRSVAFPSSMVDRITPVTTDLQQQQLRRSHGIADGLALFPEPFTQWVVTDEFSAGRPPWEEVGVELVTDVRPFVDAKTRLLNGSHVALGYLGGRLGHRTTADAMADPRVAGLVDRLMRDEVVPTLAREAVDVTSYRRAVRARLSADAVPDSLDRLRRRGSARVANYVVPTIQDALAEGTPYAVLVLTLAAWVDHLRVAATSRPGLAALADPLAEELLPLAQLAPVDPRPLLAKTAIFGHLGEDGRFVSAFRAAFSDLMEGESTVAS